MPDGRRVQLLDEGGADPLTGTSLDTEAAG